jgi:D-alanyl-D-alanine-carboxypeptidase/D-alanyl-D-alanine-endopeptidase
MYLRCLAWTFLFAPLAALSAELAPTDAAVRELARAWLISNDGVGLSIGVYDNGERRFYNFGATRLDGNKPPTKDTIYEIGSIGKTMTGQLLARAVVEGRAQLTDEASKYLDEPYPNLESGGERIRLVHLANMTSQLVDNIPDITQVRAVLGEPLVVTRMRVMEKYTRAEFLRQLHRIAPRRAPGSDPGHTNVASVLLGVVLEKLYEEPFDIVLTREIEKPLKMASGTAPLTKLLARGYTSDNEELPTYAAKMSQASGSLRYSTDDLLKYAAWQVVERDASVKVAHQPTWFTPDRKQSVALYWIGSESPQGRRLVYSGGTFGFAGVCDLYPDAKVAVVLLSNKVTDGAQESLRALSGKIVGLVKSAETTSSTPTGVPPAAR